MVNELISASFNSCLLVLEKPIFMGFSIYHQPDGNCSNSCSILSAVVTMRAEAE